MALIYYEPWEKRITEQSLRKPKRTDVQRGTPIAFASVKSRETNKIPVPEHVVDFMKNMNPQQLGDFLLLTTGE